MPSPKSLKIKRLVVGLRVRSAGEEVKRKRPKAVRSESERKSRKGSSLEEDQKIKV